MPSITLKDRTSDRLLLLFAFLICCVWFYGISIHAGSFGQIGRDPDDVMRYVQIRDWLNGQSWFDTNQYRLGLASGTDMHWSRLPDIPIALLAIFFELFMSQEKALHLAAALWPPLLALGFLAIIYNGAKYLASPSLVRPTRIAALCLGLVYVVMVGRFRPGSIDHHNIQIVLMLGSLIWLIKDQSFKHGLYSGVCAGLAIAIGPEIYPFVGLVGVFVACDWAWFGDARRKRSLGFGLGFAISLASLFLLTVSPSDWSRVYCDQLSSVIVIVAMIGGIGLFLSAYLFSSKSMFVRIASLSVIGIVSLLFVKFYASQCLGNPLNDLPETMHIYWLDNISEAKPLLGDLAKNLYNVPYRIGTAIIAIIVLLWSVYIRKEFESYRILFVILLFAAILLTFYQVRFFLFAQMVAILPLSYWIAKTHQAGKLKKNNIAYIGAIVLSLPMLLALPGYLMKPAENKVSEDVADIDCLPDDLISELNQYSKQVIFSQSNSGPTLLKLTPHHVLNANYHRNVDGIEAAINISSSSPQDAKNLIEDNQVGYVLTCEKDKVLELYLRDSPDGFAVTLFENTPPDWLSEIEGSWSDKGVKLYKVVD